MKITFTNNAGDICVKVEGRLDTVTAPEFEAFINEKIEGAKSLTVDCEALEYVSSAGLRVLLGAQKKMPGSMKLINVCEVVMEVFEMTGFAEILTIE